MGFTPNDAAHFFFALPVVAYATILIFEHYKIYRILHRHSEAIFIILLGIPIFFSDLVAYYGCPQGDMTCQNINYMHMFFGVFMIEAGILGILQERGGVWATFPKLMSPLVLFFLGFFMTLHSQNTEYGSFIHKTFGYSAIVTAMFRYLSFDNPSKYLVVACYSAMNTALFFVMGSDSVEEYWHHRMMVHNVVFLVIVIILAYFLLVMGFVSWKLRGRPTYTALTIVAEEKRPSSDEVILGGNIIPLTPLDNSLPNLTERR